MEKKNRVNNCLCKNNKVKIIIDLRKNDLIKLATEFWFFFFFVLKD